VPASTAPSFTHPRINNFEPFNPSPSFACKDCHNILYFSDSASRGWNSLISHLTAGLLYGHEVPPPIWYTPGQNRKIHRTRHLNARPPLKRQAVLRRLLNGWSNLKIAHDLQISKSAVAQHIGILCRQENVPNRHALAAKFNPKATLPLNQEERSAQRRIILAQLLASGLPRSEIMTQLQIDLPILDRDTQLIYKLHNITGQKQRSRQALAAKLGLPHNSPSTLLRQKIADLHHSGLTCSQIARQLNCTYLTIYHHLAKIRQITELSPPSPGGAQDSSPGRQPWVEVPIKT
jgi:DNA-binding CsgD family transcriptional regulator